MVIARVYINACVADPDADALFEAWLASRGPCVVPERWRADLAGLVRRLDLKSADAGLILATTKGEIDEEVAWIRQQDAVPDSSKPKPFSAVAGALAAAVGIRGPAYVVSTACSSGLTALIDAAHTLLDDPPSFGAAPGAAREMVVVAYDHAGDFVRDGFTALKALSPTQCRPFDKSRDGLALGSAAAACRISLVPADKPAAILSGWGLASDAVHMTAPDQAASGLIRAIRHALAMAKLQPPDIDLVFAHGTGTRYNDAMEGVAITTVFGGIDGADQRPAVTAVKGLVGHTLGAAGLLETVLAVKILERQIVPPVTGLRGADRTELNLVIGRPRAMALRHVLKVASGFGGLNAAVVLSKCDAVGDQEAA